MSSKKDDPAYARKKKKEAEKFEKFIEVQEKTRKKVVDVDDLIGDEVSEFERQRIKSDLEREREKKKIRDEKLHERRERERMGAAAWFEYKEQELKQKEKEEREVRADSVAHDVALRKEIREARRADRLEIDRRHEEYEKMQKRWKEEDESREREKAIDERREREAVWARLDTKKAALSREREEWAKEREKRDEQRAFDKEIREKREQAQKERDHSVAQDLAKIKEKQHREKTRYFNRNDASPLNNNVSGSDFRDLEANSHFRETFRSKGHAAARRNRLNQSEAQMEDLGRWYKNRDYDRFERHHQALRAIYN